MASVELPVPRAGDEPVLIEYLDLDHDGVPDAVHITRTFAVDRTGDGVVDSIQIVDEVSAAIDIDGVPHRVEIHRRS